MPGLGTPGLVTAGVCGSCGSGGGEGGAKGSGPTIVGACPTVLHFSGLILFFQAPGGLGCSAWLRSGQAQ